jgi:hypothetical protein
MLLYNSKGQKVPFSVKIYPKRKPTLNRGLNIGGSKICLFEHSTPNSTHYYTVCDSPFGGGYKDIFSSLDEAIREYKRRAALATRGYTVSHVRHIDPDTFDWCLD